MYSRKFLHSKHHIIRMAATLDSVQVSYSHQLSVPGHHHLMQRGQRFSEWLLNVVRTSKSVMKKPVSQYLAYLSWIVLIAIIHYLRRSQASTVISLSQFISVLITSLLERQQ
ncbi:hypothetical protein BDR05DRAFT_628657 [Suillus weaverae]|nr:hypothetical protein BDR05DRAFT_628657 [Suillus weaverae]